MDKTVYEKKTMTSIEKLCLKEAAQLRSNALSSLTELDYAIMEGLVYNAGINAVYQLLPDAQYKAVQQGLADNEGEPEYMMLKNIAVGLILLQMALIY